MYAELMLFYMLEITNKRDIHSTLLFPMLLILNRATANQKYSIKRKGNYFGELHEICESQKLLKSFIVKMISINWI